MRLDDVSPHPSWLDGPRRAEAPPLDGEVEADLAIVGGGFTGLWAALLAKQERPEREVVVLEAETAGWGAGGRAVYAVGYTGVGVGATRFGARTALDLLDGAETERTRLKLVRSRPLPFPPEPARWAVIQATRVALARADAHGGRRGPWLQLLDRLGLGFDT